MPRRDPTVASDQPTPPSSGGEPPRLWPFRAFYFFNFGALGALFPFLPLLLADRGFSPSEIALVMVIHPVASLVVPPLWGALADALRGRLLLLRLASAASGLAALLLLPRWGLAGSVAAMSAYALVRTPLTSLADAAVYDAMGGGERVDFSRVRVWGSAGFALFVLAAGLVEGSLRPEVLLPLTCCIHVAAAGSTLPLGRPPMSRQRGVVRMAWRTLSRPSLLLFLLATAIYYAGHSCYDVYFGLHALRLDLDDRFVGIAWAVAVVAEIGLMLIAPRFLHSVSSRATLVLCAVVAASRWALLARVESPAAILASQPLHAVTFGLWYLGLVKHVQSRAREELRTSLQAVALACMGLGMVAGSLAGGPLFERGGGELLFLCAAGAAALAALLYAVTALGSSSSGRRGR